MSHDGSTMRNYIHEKMHKQIVENLQTELAETKARLQSADSLLEECKVFLKQQCSTETFLEERINEHFAKYEDGK